jgi:hypothetical protein
MPTTSEGFLQMVRLQQLQLEQQQNAIHHIRQSVHISIH